MNEEKQISLQQFLEEDKPFLCRLNRDEKKYLYWYWNCEFSKYVHDCFKRDIQLTKVNKKQNILQNMTSNVILLGFGAIFLLFSFSNSIDLASFYLLFFIGIFFMITGLVNIVLEVRKQWLIHS